MRYSTALWFVDRSTYSVCCDQGVSTLLAFPMGWVLCDVLLGEDIGRELYRFALKAMKSSITGASEGQVKLNGDKGKNERREWHPR